MLKAFKYRLYPTSEQEGLINKHIGCARLIYNLALDVKKSAWSGNQVNISCFDLMKQLTELKKECEWLKEVNSQSLQQAIKNLDRAYSAFFKGQNKFPKFKSKNVGKGTFNVPQNVKLEDDKLVIPKFKGGIKVKLHRPIKGEIRQATISRTPSGKYYASILCETGEVNVNPPEITDNNTIGVDLGIKDFAITSNGEVIENPKYLRKAQKKLKFIQRKYSKNKGKRTKRKLTKAHEKVANKRKDFLHKVSTKLVRENQSIALESLNVSGMLKNHCLAQSISDVGWSSFVSMLEYKADWYGVNILRIGTFEPSSKRCSCCGNIKDDLTLDQRLYNCNECGLEIDRDINASLNIKYFALLKHFSTEHREKNRSELPSLEGVLTCEALPL